MALLFTLLQQTKLSSAIILFAVLTSSYLSAQNYTVNKVDSAIVYEQMQWIYGGYRFTIDIPLNRNTYKYYKKLSKKNSYASFAQENREYPYFSQLVKRLKVDADELGYKGRELAEYLTAFVQQNIRYIKDPYNNGFDYPKFPIETLVERKGDCEDTAILLVSLLKLFGFDALLIELPKHMAVGIACSNCKTYYKFESKRYVYIETTNPNWDIGKLPSDYEKTSAKLIKTPNLPTYYKQTKTLTSNKEDEFLDLKIKFNSTVSEIVKLFNNLKI